MSSSEPAARQDLLAEVAEQLELQVDKVISQSDGVPSEIDADTLRAVVTAAARLYAHYGEALGPVDPLHADVSPTAAVDLACGLLRARDLNPFDLALWFRAG